MPSCAYVTASRRQAQKSSNQTPEMMPRGEKYSVSVQTWVYSGITRFALDVMGGLHHEYVRRVVDTLANFEDELIATNGFFAREEHFESCIDGVRAEFEVDRRAIAIFAAPDTLSDLISTLCDAEAEALSQRGESKERRRFENAFAASVLLSSSIGVRGLLRNPPLLQQMWQFVERPPIHTPRPCGVHGS